MKWIFISIKYIIYIMLTVIVISCIGDLSIRYLDYSAKKSILEIVKKSCSYYKQFNKFPESAGMRPQGIKLEKKWIDSSVRYSLKQELDKKRKIIKTYHDEAIVMYNPLWSTSEFYYFVLSYNKQYRSKVDIYNIPIHCK